MTQLATNSRRYPSQQFDLGPWSLKVYDADGPHVPWRVELYYRNNLFAYWEPEPGVDVSFLCNDHAYQALTKLRDGPYTPTHMNFLYQTDPLLRHLAQWLAYTARLQKNAVSWPFDDVVSLRGDALGHVIYDIIKET